MKKIRLRIKNPKSIKNVYKEFLGRRSNKEYLIEIGDLSELTEIGKVDRLDYLAKKSHFKDKDIVIYMHNFEKKPKLLTNGKILIIYGNFKITSKGIEG